MGRPPRPAFARRRASCQRVVTGRGGLTSPLATTDATAKVGRERPEREGSCRAADAYARWVSRRQGLHTADSVWAAAEAASPVEAVEAVTRELGQVLGATKVSFLIADLSGRALVRLAHVHLSAAVCAA